MKSWDKIKYSYTPRTQRYHLRTIYKHEKTEKNINKLYIWAKNELVKSTNNVWVYINSYQDLLSRYHNLQLKNGELFDAYENLSNSYENLLKENHDNCTIPAHVQ